MKKGRDIKRLADTLTRPFRARGFWRGVLIIGMAVVFLIATMLLLNLTLTSAGKLKDIAAIIQSSVTAVAIAAGGLFAYYKLQWFRDLEPHLTITHEVSHRPIGDSYVHIAITATLYNSSRVKLGLREGFFLVQQVSPSSDEDVEAWYGEVFVRREQSEILWPTLDEKPLSWGENELIVEPGESHREAYECIVSRETESVLIYTYYYNPEYAEHLPSPEGWEASTVYDIFRHE